MTEKEKCCPDSYPTAGTLNYKPFWQQRMDWLWETHAEL